MSATKVTALLAVLALTAAALLTGCPDNSKPGLTPGTGSASATPTASAAPTASAKSGGGGW